MTKTAHQSKTTTKVLIIEDEGEMCLLLNILLGEEEMELSHVSTILDADAYLKREHPSVIILDNRLPDGFGVDFVSYIKKNYPSIKIIMISGYAASAKDVALENGADCFIEKPFSKNQIYQAITALLD